MHSFSLAFLLMIFYLKHFQIKSKTFLVLIGVVVSAALIFSKGDRQNVKVGMTQLRSIGRDEEVIGLLERETNLEKPLRCPLNGDWFTPGSYSAYCIYAVGICGRKYLKELLVNDVNFESKMCENIEIEDLGRSAIHPCDYRSLTVPAYGGGVVRVENCRGECEGTGRIQVFFMCCRMCKEAVDTDSQRMLTQLKLLYFAQSDFNLRSVILKRPSGQSGVKEAKEMSYMIARKLNETQRRRVCLRGNGTDVDVTATLLNKRACVSVIGVRNPLFNSSQLRMMRRPREIRAQFGEQTISLMDSSENIPAYHYGLNSCHKDYRRNETIVVDTCKTFTRGDELLFICCCYGRAPMTCQMRLQNGVLPSYVAMAAWDIRCLIDVGKIIGYENDTLINVVHNMEKKEVLYDHHLSEKHIQNGISRQLRAVCESTIYRHGKQIRFVHNDRDDAPPILQKASTCEDLYYEDRRLASFLHKPCFPTMPLNTMCPFNDDAINDKVDVMTCCCASSGFCNVDLFLRNRAMYRPNKNCRYNNDYQHLTNKFFIEDSIENHSCIVHYANQEVMKDLIGLEVPHGQVLNVYPGAAIIPIDYSYATLSVGECDYIETKVNRRYVETRECNETTQRYVQKNECNEATQTYVETSEYNETTQRYVETKECNETVHPTLESDYLPLKLFVCRCSTDSGRTRMKQCDVDLRKKIPYKEKAKATEKAVRHQTYCAVVTSKSIHEFVKRITTSKYQKFNRLSSVCYTKAIFDPETRDVIRYEAGIATRKMANGNKMPMDHFAFLLLARFATEEDRCLIDVTNNKTIDAVCFCRNYTNDGMLSCNSDQKEVLITIRVAVQRMSKQVVDVENITPELDLKKQEKIDDDYKVVVFTDTTMNSNEDVVDSDSTNSSISKVQRAVCSANLISNKNGCVELQRQIVCCCKKCKQLSNDVQKLILN